MKALRAVVGFSLLGVVFLSVPGCSETLRFDDSVDGGAEGGSTPPEAVSPPAPTDEAALREATGAVSCDSDAACVRGVCNVAEQRCVECTNASSCGGAGNRCELATGRCVMLCDDNDPCRALGYKGCDSDGAGDFCSECHEDEHCEGRGVRTHCSRIDGKCLECLVDADCPSDRPRCEPGFGTCRA